MDAIATTQKVQDVGGVATELCIMQFADRFFVVVTQLNKPGTLVRPAPPRPAAHSLPVQLCSGSAGPASCLPSPRAAGSSSSSGGGSLRSIAHSSPSASCALLCQIRAQLEQGPDGVSAFGVSTLMGRRDDEMLEVFARRLIEDISGSAGGAGKQLLLAIGLQQGTSERSGADFRGLLQLVLDHKVW
eukprot:COSAG06_NODE_2287_length_7155_cov_20.776927_6_plen_187_part_00